MKLKDILPYCINYGIKPGCGYSSCEVKYYWVINGSTYIIDSLQTHHPDYQYDGIFDHKLHFDAVNYIYLSRYKFYTHQDKNDAKYDYLTLNLDNEITIFDKFIMVHKTHSETTDSEMNLFFNTHYFIANGHDCSAQMYNIGLYHSDAVGGMATNLRLLFKDLISLSAITKKPEAFVDDRTIDQKLDDIVEELVDQSKTKAIKKLKRMLNERL